MYWHPPDPNVVRVHASLAVAQSVTLGHCGKQPAHTNFKLVFSWKCVTKAKLKMVFVFASLASFYNTIVCFHQQKQTKASRKYKSLTQIQPHIPYVSMHEYTYAGALCDTDVNATLMEMRAGGLCVMIE